jgi:hypothetical protein
MATTTPNYGWPVPTSTDYVKDGATAIEALGDAIDATVFGLGQGLKLIKSQVIGTTVSSVNVTGAFSASYPAYKIIISGGTKSVGGNMTLKLGASATQYYWSGLLLGYAGGGTSAIQGSNQTSFTYAGYGSSVVNIFDVDLINAGTADYTIYQAKYTAIADATYQQGIHQVATAYTDFTITPASGTMTGGTIYVYGYGSS